MSIQTIFPDAKRTIDSKEYTCEEFQTEKGKKSCANGGLCYWNQYNNDTLCYCDPDHTGPDCNDVRGKTNFYTIIINTMFYFYHHVSANYIFNNDIRATEK